MTLLGYSVFEGNDTSTKYTAESVIFLLKRKGAPYTMCAPVFAAPTGVEPIHADPESAVLPLDDGAMNYDTKITKFRNKTNIRYLVFCFFLFHIRSDNFFHALF